MIQIVAEQQENEREEEPIEHKDQEISETKPDIESNIIDVEQVSFGKYFNLLSWH